MYKFAIAFMTLFLAGCCCDPSYVPSYRRDNGAADAPVYRKTARRAAYTKYVAPKGDVIHAAGFDIQQGQQMRDFFDDFEEPMHARYVGNNTVRWTYYVDYEPDDGKIVRYCELGDYQPPQPVHADGGILPHVRQQRIQRLRRSAGNDGV